MQKFIGKMAGTKLLGYLLAAVTIFFWGITFVSTKYLLNDFSSVEILFYRVIIAFAGLWLIHPKYQRFSLKANVLQALAALTGVVIYQLM